MNTNGYRAERNVKRKISYCCSGCEGHRCSQAVTRIGIYKILQPGKILRLRKTCQEEGKSYEKESGHPADQLFDLAEIVICTGVVSLPMPVDKSLVSMGIGGKPDNT